MPLFTLSTQLKPQGDQPKAIKQILQGYKKGRNRQTLMGVTGSGKTFTMANVIAKLSLPTLVISHNKTLAAQLFNEFSQFFPKNKVCYFISYYDYYQPESYIPQTDTYIEKDASINEKIERLRLEATTSLLTRKDVIVVASVSCIFGLGRPDEFQANAFTIKTGKKFSRDELLAALVNLQYERNDLQIKSGDFRAKGDVVEFVPGFSMDIVRVEFFGDVLERITILDPMTRTKKGTLAELRIFPSKVFVFNEISKKQAMRAIHKELVERLPHLGPLEQYRLKTRTEYDLEQIAAFGYCKGIENYSRHFDGRLPGVPPYCLLDYFPKKYLCIIDESHITLPQVHGMQKGDYARKKNLVDYGFRLPCAHDNRPLTFDEFQEHLQDVFELYTSATPGEYELTKSQQVVEQIIRPTGLVDPEITIKSIEGQIEDLMEECRHVILRGWRILITTLTKRMAEELTRFLVEHDIRARYLHSDIDTLKRNDIIRDFRLGKFDVLVGINLLREGLDLPEVALVCILDADKEGFLRNQKSLIQTIGRTARNVEGRVIFYADVITQSMKQAILETDRRRELQTAYNKKHHITPKNIVKTVFQEEHPILGDVSKSSRDEVIATIGRLEVSMQTAAENMDFEQAIELRDKIKELEVLLRKK